MSPQLRWRCNSLMVFSLVPFAQDPRVAKVLKKVMDFLGQAESKGLIYLICVNKSSRVLLGC